MLTTKMVYSNINYNAEDVYILALHADKYILQHSTNTKCVIFQHRLDIRCYGNYTKIE